MYKIKAVNANINTIRKINVAKNSISSAGLNWALVK